jgi:hypothetical protein
VACKAPGLLLNSDTQPEAFWNFSREVNPFSDSKITKECLQVLHFLTKGTYFLKFSPENWSSIFLRNVGITYKSARRHRPEEQHPHLHHRENIIARMNLKSVTCESKNFERTVTKPQKRRSLFSVSLFGKTWKHRSERHSAICCFHSRDWR